MICCRDVGLAGFWSAFRLCSRVQWISRTHWGFWWDSDCRWGSIRPGIWGPSTATARALRHATDVGSRRCHFI